MAFLAKHPAGVMEVLNRNAKEVIRVLRRHPVDAQAILSSGFTLSDSAAVQMCLKNVSQQPAIMQVMNGLNCNS